MSSFHSAALLAGLVLVGVVYGDAQAADRTGYYGYGAHATEAEIAGWDIDVRPDGKGLPPGSGSVEDGEMLYEDKCAECHGSFGEGVGRFPVLAGGEGSLTDQRPSKTVGSFWAHTSTLWDYIHRTMPFTQPESLSDDEVYSLTAYVLYLNDLVEDDFVLSKENFTSIVLPNKPNFIPDSRPDVHNTRCMKNCKKPENIHVVSIVMPAEDNGAVDAQKEASRQKALQPGELVYNQNCAICHNAGVSGAPVIGDVADWKTRVAAGMLTLKQHAIKGFTGAKGFMPPKGGFLNLSDEDVNETVEFIVESSR
jgi:cytochrome c5